MASTLGATTSWANLCTASLSISSSSDNLDKELMPKGESNSAAIARGVDEEKERALAPVREAEALKTLEERGMTLHEFDSSSFAAAAVKLQDQLATERGAQDLLEKIRAAAR